MYSVSVLEMNKTKTGTSMKTAFSKEDDNFSCVLRSYTVSDCENTLSRKQKRMTRLSSHVWAEEVSNASNQPSSTWFISKSSWKRLRCSLASWRDWRLRSLRALLNFSPLARYIRTQDKLWVHSPECWEWSIMLGDAKMFYTTGKGCLWVWGNLTATNF